MTSDLALFRPLLETRAFQDLERRAGAGKRGLAITGLVEGARAQLVGAGVAVYPSIERAAWALSRFVSYWEGRSA